MMAETRSVVTESVTTGTVSDSRVRRLFTGDCETQTPESVTVRSGRAARTVRLY